MEIPENPLTGNQAFETYDNKIMLAHYKLKTT